MRLTTVPQSISCNRHAPTSSHNFSFSPTLPLLYLLTLSVGHLRDSDGHSRSGGVAFFLSDRGRCRSQRTPKRHQHPEFSSWASELGHVYPRTHHTSFALPRHQVHAMIKVSLSEHENTRRASFPPGLEKASRWNEIRIANSTSTPSSPPQRDHACAHTSMPTPTAQNSRISLPPSPPTVHASAVPLSGGPGCRRTTHNHASGAFCQRRHATMPGLPGRTADWRETGF